MNDRAEIHCGVVLNSLVVSLGHVQDDESVTISTKFVKIRGRSGETMRRLVHKSMCSRLE